MPEKRDETCYFLTVHGGEGDPDSALPFEIPSGEQIRVWYYRAPWPDGVHATRFESRLDHPVAVRKWSLYATPNAPFEPGHHDHWYPWVGQDGVVLLGTAEGGARRLNAPPGVGLWLPPQGSLIALVWHYINDENGLQDRSSVRVCTELASARPSASLVVLGTEELNSDGIPPGEHSFSGKCTNEQPSVRVHAVAPRMHQHGVSLQLSVSHADGRIDVPFDEPFDVGCPRFSPTVFDLEPGAVLTTTCSFRNDEAYPVPYGISFWTESCYLLAIASPAFALWSKQTLTLSGLTNSCSNWP